MPFRKTYFIKTASSLWCLVEGGGKFALTKVDITSMDQVTIKNAAIIGDGLNTRDYYDYTYLALLKR